MDKKVFSVDIAGYNAQLPILSISPTLDIAFFNLHGNQKLTEHCGKQLAKIITDCDVLITAESKGLQLCHVVARELGHEYYAVARKSKKLYMQDGLDVLIDASITTGKEQHLYLSKHDADLLKGKKVCIVDDVVSTGASLKGLENIVNLAGGIITEKVFVLAEADAANRTDVKYLAVIPVFPHN
ncbi:MAG: adenine phosphoribosyltransferase [Clostridia bacterium]|nr:adenine phosphoribosyltransferase [Clostridia bacterium]